MSPTEKDIEVAIKKAKKIIQSNRKKQSFPKPDKRISNAISKLNKASDLDPKHLDEPVTL